MRQAPELVLRQGHLGAEGRAGLQAGIADAGGQARNIHVALPVGAGDDAADAGLPGAGVDGIGGRRIDLRQDECRRPAAHRVSGGVAALAAELGIVLQERFLLEIDERPRAMVVGLGGDAHLVGRHEAGGDELPQLGRAFRRDFMPEGYAQLVKQGFVAPDGIPAGHGRPLCILSLRLAPFVALHVVFECRRAFLRGRGKAPDQVGQLFCREVRLHRRFLRTHAPIAKNREQDKCYYPFHTAHH